MTSLQILCVAVEAGYAPGPAGAWSGQLSILEDACRHCRIHQDRQGINFIMIQMCNTSNSIVYYSLFYATSTATQFLHLFVWRCVVPGQSMKLLTTSPQAQLGSLQQNRIITLSFLSRYIITLFNNGVLNLKSFAIIVLLNHD